MTFRLDDWVTNYRGQLYIAERGDFSLSSSAIYFDPNTKILTAKCRRASGIAGDDAQSTIDLSPYLLKDTYGNFYWNSEACRSKYQQNQATVFNH